MIQNQVKADAHDGTEKQTLCVKEMKASEIMEITGNAYLAMNRPCVKNPDTMSAVAEILAVLPKANDETISELISDGSSWRERLVGIVLAVGHGSPSFSDPIIDSFRKHPTGLAFVPAFAALAVIVRSQPSPELLQDLSTLDRTLFDGDLGWSMDKFLFHVGSSPHDPGGKSPNDAKSFEDNLEVFKMIKDTQPKPEGDGKPAP